MSHDIAQMAGQILSLAFNAGDLDAMGAEFTPNRVVHDPGHDCRGPTQMTARPNQLGIVRQLSWEGIQR